jgi:hypothetical protein
MLAARARIITKQSRAMASPLRATLEQVATAPDARPTLPRSGASAVVVKDQVLMLCGYDECKNADANATTPPQRNATNDAFAFSASDHTWHALAIATARQDLPTPRLAAGAVELGGSAYLIGGWAAGGPAHGADAFLADVWRLAPASPASSSSAAWTWTRLELEPGSVEALGGGGVSRFACAAVSSTRAILHTHRCSDHVVALDVASSSSSVNAAAATARFSRLPVLPDPEHGAPSSRGLQSMTLVGGGKRLLVFGGAPQKGGMLGDLWALDGDFVAGGGGELRWTRLWGGPAEGDADSAAAPHVRCSHVAADVDGGLFILGGSYYTEQGSLCPLDDAWRFDLKGGKGWQKVALEGATPAARNAAILAPLGGQRLLYHGGWRPFVETYDDTWIISF